MTRHVSTENLARFTGGDLRGPRARRVEAHLRGCARCRQTTARLDDVPALLAATRVPEMPAHLAARIETALATESAHRAASAPSASASRTSGPDRVSHPAAPRRGRKRPRMAAPALRLATAAAVVVVVAGGGIELATHLAGSAGPGPSSAAGGGAAKRAASQPQQAAPNYGPMYHVNGHRILIPTLHTRTDYRADSLGQQAAGILARATMPSAIPNQHRTMTPAVGGHPLPFSPLSGCVNRVAAGRDVLLVDLARFGHARATLIITASRGMAREAWIVGPRCSAAASHVLAHQRLPGSR
jgi:hypothetical protein